MISRFSKTFETNKDSDSLNFGVFLERKNIRENIQEKKKKILVIDDSADLLLVICTILELDQYEVLSAETVASALSLIAGLDRIFWRALPLVVHAAQRIDRWHISLIGRSLHQFEGLRQIHRSSLATTTHLSQIFL